jgi:hypothetical protein
MCEFVLDVKNFMNYVYDGSDAEVPSGELLTEQTGYRPVSSIVEGFMLAGQALQRARAEQFDADANDDRDDKDIPVDPTTDYDFSEMDAVDALKNIKPAPGKTPAPDGKKESGKTDNADSGQQDSTISNN